MLLQYDETGQMPEENWLRHRTLGGELDRLLIKGATSNELAEIRGSWMPHIGHLRGEHRVTVLEHPTGFWRISPTLPVDASAPNVPETVIPDVAYFQNRFTVTARAIAALAQHGLHVDPRLKASVGMLIRQASESNHWHVCAHFRSLAAAQMIGEHDIHTRAQYQQFCMANLRHEHVVPNSVIYRIIGRRVNEATEVNEIEAILRTFCLRATITLDEDTCLNDAGLRNTMPQGFDIPGHEYFEDPMARYRTVGLMNKIETRGVQLWIAGPDGEPDEV
jgi:hypothetical protein